MVNSISSLDSTTLKICAGIEREADYISFSDYIFLRLSMLGLRNAFGVSGGGIMHLLDSVFRNSSITFVPFHHEAHAGYAADGYVKASRRLACVLATTGPGAANVIPSIVSAWQDSVPILFLSGQCKTTESTEYNNLEGLRTLGPAEFNIVKPAAHFTKYTRLIPDPQNGISILEEALQAIYSDRYGPALLDIPLDVQASRLSIDDVISFLASLSPQFCIAKNQYNPSINISEVASFLNNQLASAEKPLFLLGAGIERAGLSEKYIDAVSELGIPYIASSSAKSLCNAKLDYYIGNPGIRGSRSANIALDYADLLIVVESSLHPQVCGWDPAAFSPGAKIIYIDADETQILFKKQQFKLNAVFCMTAHVFLDSLNHLVSLARDFIPSLSWLSYCSYLRNEFLTEFHHQQVSGMSYYSVVDALNDLSGSCSISCVVSDAGTSWYVVGQHFQPRVSTSLITSASFGGMGYALPALIGASLATDNICIAVTGDGSVHMCIQELATLSLIQKPCFLVVVNNSGYMSIRNTQNKYCQGRLIGTDTSNGVFIPSFSKLCDAYELDYMLASSKEHLVACLSSGIQRPTLIEVMVVADEELRPSAVSTFNALTGKFSFEGLSNMKPEVHFLTYDEFLLTLG